MSNQIAATEKGLRLLQEITKSEYLDAANLDDAIGYQVWTFSVLTHLDNPKSAGGIIAGLSEQGFVGHQTVTYSREEGPMDLIWITAEGVEELKRTGWTWEMRRVDW
jgi:hypothetical protein